MEHGAEHYAAYSEQYGEQMMGDMAAYHYGPMGGFMPWGYMMPMPPEAIPQERDYAGDYDFFSGRSLGGDDGG